MLEFFFFIVLDIPYLVSQQMKGMSRAISLLISSFFFFNTVTATVPILAPQWLLTT